MSTTPRVFISYSHDTPAFMQQVLVFADQLRTHGIDARIDQYDSAPSQGWPRWMEQEIEAADFVLLVCTETYHQRVSMNAAPGTGLGALWESHIIYQLLYEAGTVNPRFIAVMPPGSKVDNIPTVLRGSQRYEPFTEDGFWDLYRRLTEQPAVVMPALGERVVLSPAIPAGTAIERSVSTVTCANSPLALISVPEDGVVVFIPVVESHWGDQEAVLLLQPDDQGDGAVLNGLRNGRREIRIAFRENVALASVGAVQQKSINGVDQWEVKFQLRKTEFSPSLEFSTAGLGPAEAAEIRAKRLLLNQDLANANSRRMEGMMQECQGRSKTKPVWRSKSRPVVGCEVGG